MAPEQSRKQGHHHGNIMQNGMLGIIKELAEEVDEKGRLALQKLRAKVENEEVVQVEGIIKETITRMCADNEDVPELLEKLQKKLLHLVSKDGQQVGSMEDRGLKTDDDSLYAKEKSENRPERFKIKTINVGGVVKEGEDHK